MSAYLFAIAMVLSGACYLLYSRLERRRIGAYLRSKGYLEVPRAGVSAGEALTVYPMSRTAVKECCFSLGDHAVYWVSWPLGSIGGSVRYTVYQAGKAGSLPLEARHRTINKGVVGRGLDHPHCQWLWISEGSGALGVAIADDAEVVRRLAKWEASLYVQDDNFYFISGRNLRKADELEHFIEDAAQAKWQTDLQRRRLRGKSPAL